MSTTCLGVQWDWWTPDQNGSPGGRDFCPLCSLNSAKCLENGLCTVATLCTVDRMKLLGCLSVPGAPQPAARDPCSGYTQDRRPRPTDRT